MSWFKKKDEKVSDVAISELQAKCEKLVKRINIIDRCYRAEDSSLREDVTYDIKVIKRDLEAITGDLYAKYYRLNARIGETCEKSSKKQA